MGSAKGPTPCITLPFLSQPSSTHQKPFPCLAAMWRCLLAKREVSNVPQKSSAAVSGTTVTCRILWAKPSQRSPVLPSFELYSDCPTVLLTCVLLPPVRQRDYQWLDQQCNFLTGADRAYVCNCGLSCVARTQRSSLVQFLI